MDILQERIIDKSDDAIHLFSPVRLIVSTVIYAAIVIALFLIFNLDMLDVSMYVIVIAVAFLYGAFNEYLNIKRSKNVLVYQYRYSVENHPNMTLYIPMLHIQDDKPYVQVKRAGLYVKEGKLFLEAFEQKGLSSKPKNSISIRLGTDFNILSRTYDSEKGLHVFKAKLLDTEYTFALVDEPEMIAYFEDVPMEDDATNEIINEKEEG